MAGSGDKQELYHEIFGSILDRREMTPYLLRNCAGYAQALQRATRMMANRGFDVVDGELRAGEKERAFAYARQAIAYLTGSLCPFVEGQLRALAELGTPRRELYGRLADSIGEIKRAAADPTFSALVAEDPRHLFLLSSSLKYPTLFDGYRGGPFEVEPRLQRMGCSVLKLCHLIKSIEEDSQDINDYARLGLFFESHGMGLTDLFSFDWDNPPLIPADESAQRAFVRLSMFFHKLGESIRRDGESGALVFDSGDGVTVALAEVKARLKSPESMFAKLGKSAEEEAYNIRDILAVTLLLEERDDSLTLFHALQKRGVILQENTGSTSITQTLYDDPKDMEEAVGRLMRGLSRSGGSEEEPDAEEVRANAREFFKALSVNAKANPHSADRHRKFQCKITFSLPVHRDAASLRVLVPGTAAYSYRDRIDVITQQHTLPVELRISDRRSWRESEQTGEAHHDAYKCRQHIFLLDRLFAPLFEFPADALPGLRADQERLFA